METKQVNIPLLRISNTRVQTGRESVPEITYYRKRGPKGELEESFKIVNNTK